MANYYEGARVYHSAAINIPPSTDTVLPFDSERWDTDEIHDKVTNNSRLTCKTAGKYLIIGNVQWAANATNMRNLRIKLNGATKIAENRLCAPASGAAYELVQTIYDLDVGDYVELEAYQDSGSTIEISTGVQYSPEFMMQRIGDPLSGEGARVYHDVAQEVPSETDVILAFNSERWDTDGIHDTVTNNSRLTCRTAGKYVIIGNIQYEANSAEMRYLGIQLNGAFPLIGQNRLKATPTGDAFILVQTIYDLSVGDYVELWAFQDTGYYVPPGATLEVRANAQVSPEFMMQRIG